MSEQDILERLKQILEKRFFAHAELIKANTVLRKAWDPCNVGLARLRGLEKDRGIDQREGEKSRKLLDSVELPGGTQQVVAGYITRSLDAVRTDLENINILRSHLDNLRHRARSNFNALEADMRILEALETEEAETLSADERIELARICGFNGVEPWSRLGFEVAPDEAPAALVERAENLLDTWERHRQRGIPHRRLASHACDRINQVLDYLEPAAP